MERHLDEFLSELRNKLLEMSSCAESMISRAIAALVERDTSAVPQVYEYEERVNRLQIEVDELCLRIIALFQPAASDLRYIIGAVKTNTDLERLADLAVNICHKAERLLQEPPAGEFQVVPRMAEIASQMVKESLRAYVDRAPESARAVLARDKALDDGKAEVTANVLRLMERDPQHARRALDIALVSRNLERIGDHAKNIAENAIFVAEGKDVRHGAGRLG